MSRRAMLAPIRPSPIIPSCIRFSLVRSAQPTIAPKPPARRSASRVSVRPSRLVEVDQAVGRRVVACHRRVTVELRQDLRRELLAELYAPLIEAVDVPHDALDEDLVLVHRDER